MRFLLVLMTISLASCAAMQPRPPEEVVGERALAQAQALIDQDYDKALSFTTPAYQAGARASLYRANYNGASFWTVAEVAWVKCDAVPDPERCEVRLWIYGKFPRAGRYSSQLGESVPISRDHTWIKLDGTWYQYLD